MAIRLREAGILRRKIDRFDGWHRLSKLRIIAQVLVVLLFVKVFVTILLEYRWYFPPNFDLSDFLGGRRHTFFGIYRAGFYAHIVSGPVVLLLACLLMFSGRLARFRKLHRWGGRIQALIVLTVIVPSGLVMASQALAGPVAGCGFAALSVATAISVIAAALQARANNFQSHQRWATRCFILLCSPLLLRVVTGAAIVSNFESDWSYRLNAWFSWLVPMMMYEAWWRWSSGGDMALRLSRNLEHVKQ